MKKIIGLFLMLLFSSAFAAENATTEFITRYYKNFEDKNVAEMKKVISSDLVFYKDFNQPIYYQEFQKHLDEITTRCKTLRVLPFDKVIVTGNQTVVLYTQTCTDMANKISQKRLVVINEINSQGKIAKMWVVSHEKD